MHHVSTVDAIASPLSHLPGGWCDQRVAISGSHTAPGLLRSDSKALLSHEGDGALLHCIERVRQGALAIDGIGEIVTNVGVDLINGRSPLEIDVHLGRRLFEDRVDVLVAKEGLRAIHQGRV